MHADEGRWDCKQLVTNLTYMPTLHNAKSIETWDKHYGHVESSCRTKNKRPLFRLGPCAVNCYSQWFAGLSCPWYEMIRSESDGSLEPIRHEVPMIQQYNVAKEKIFKYNAIIITEKLKDPKYVAAMERFFGVPGVAQTKYQPWCQGESHYVNERYPLVIKNETIKRLTALNKLDITLYHEIRDCLDDNDDDTVYNNFPAWDATRFEMNETIQKNYTEYRAAWKGNLSQKWLRRFERIDEAAANNTDVLSDGEVEQESLLLEDEMISTSPVCQPHFQLALPNGSWTNATKFKRLYFYHVRKAGVSTQHIQIGNFITLCFDKYNMTFPLT